MEHIGYSLIDADGNEVQAYGNSKGQLTPGPDVLALPNGDRVYGFQAGDIFGDYRWVERWINDIAPSQWHARIGEVIAFDGDKVVVTVTYEDTPSIVPQIVTPKQARLALLAAGLLDQVQAAVDAAGGTTKITWEYASEINRNDPLIVTLGHSLGLSDEAIDQLFRDASQIA